MYRPPSRPPKGAWARHLHQRRRERNLSQAQAFELVFEGLKLSKRSRAVYAAIDMGDRQPRADEAEYLASVFGWPPEDDVPSAGSGDGISSDSAALIAAIRSLVEEMRLSRAQQDESTQALLEAVAAVAHGGRGQPETSDDTGHEAHAGTGR